MQLYPPCDRKVYKCAREFNSVRHAGDKDSLGIAMARWTQEEGYERDWIVAFMKVDNVLL